MATPLKAPSVRQGHRDNSVVVLDRAVSPAAIRRQPPKPPAKLLRSTREAWFAFWRSSLAAAVMPETDMQALVRLYRLYDQRERARLVADKTPVVEGSEGQPRPNPLFKVIGSFDVEIRQLEDRFGLSPLARARLGLAVKQLEERDALDDLLTG